MLDNAKVAMSGARYCYDCDCHLKYLHDKHGARALVAAKFFRLQHLHRRRRGSDRPPHGLVALFELGRQVELDAAVHGASLRGQLFAAPRWSDNKET